MFKKFKVALLLLFIMFSFSLPTLAKEIRIVHFSDIHLDTKNPDRKVRKFAQSEKMLQKAILKKELENLEKNPLVEKIKRLIPKKEKLICDYFN